MTQHADNIILTNWADYAPVIRQKDLGWTDDLRQEAMSDNPKTIFDYLWQHAFSIIFYYPADNNFYELFMETEPHKLWLVNKLQKWDGHYISQQIAWEEHEEGRVLATFTDDDDPWSILKIDKKPIGEVLENSLIAEINL